MKRRWKIILCLVVAAGVVSLMVLQCLAAEAPELAPVVKGNTAFAVQLYSQVKANRGNVVVSPYSLSLALAMTDAGARGQTARQIEQAIHLPTGAKALPALFGSLDAAVSAAQGDGIELHIANSLWPQNTYPFRLEFLDLLKTDYRAAVLPQDYVHQREQARAAINQWVDQSTRHKITDVIPPNTLDAFTRLVLVNAIYFKGVWDTPFPEYATRPDRFYPAPGKEITVPFMQVEGDFNWGENEDLQWLVLPYKGKRFEMVILLPRAGGIMEQEFRETRASDNNRLRKSATIDGLERAMNPNKLATWTSACRNQKIMVTIPKFKISSDLRLNGLLQALGVKDAFNPKRADFSGMDGRQHWLYLSDVLQKAFIEVDEKGTEAAAASATMMTHSSPPMFYADHPFVFVLRETATGSILFMGRVANPLSEAARL
jgi:serpin B